MNPATALFNHTWTKCIPLDVTVEFTSRCNLNCIHCYLPTGERKNRTDGELSLRQWDDILVQLKDLGTLYVTVTGGEIFTRPETVPFLRRLNQYGFIVTLFTNATLLTSARIKMLRTLNLWELHISLYSVNPSVHDGITGIRGSGKRTLSVINHLVQAGIPVVIKTVLMQNNFEGYNNIIKFAQDLGVRYQFDVVVTPRNNGDRVPLKFRVKKPQLYQFYRTQHHLYNFPPTSSELKLTQNQKVQLLNCSAGRNLAAIDTRGTVYPCIQLRHPAGNLKTQKFTDIWYPAENKSSQNILSRLRNFNVKKVHTCYNCRKLISCTRCPGLTLLEEKSLNVPSRTACRIARLRSGEVV